MQINVYIYIYIYIYVNIYHSITFYTLLFIRRLIKNLVTNCFIPSDLQLNSKLALSVLYNVVFTSMYQVINYTYRFVLTTFI